MSERDTNYWYAYDEKPVLLQLRPGCEYVGVTYPNQPIVQTNEKREAVGVISIPFLRGLLKVKPDGNGGTLLILQTSDPNPNGEGGVVDIVLHAEDVLYLSHVERKSIISS